MAARPRSLATLLALAWAALIVYASLFPFSGWRWPPGQQAVSLLRLPWPPWVDVFDLWANFGGYLPLGLFVLVALRRGGMRAGPAALLALALSAALSYAAEVTQVFLPHRHPSIKDLGMNTAGAAAGAALGSAMYALGWVDRWHVWRQRWFVGPTAGAMALLALWPVGLLFPAPVALGLGQVGEKLREWAVEGLEDVPWAAGLYDTLSEPPLQVPLWLPAEALVTALGLLAPCLVAFAAVAPGWRRLVLVAGALGLALLGMTLSTALNFGPAHGLAWVTPVTLPALAAATLTGAALVPVGRRLAAALGLVALTGLVTLVAQAPTDPYFAQSLQSWEQGRFIHFHGLAQWVGWLWPYAAMAWLVSRLASRE